MDSLTLTALLASVAAIVAIAWITYSRRLRKALGRDDLTQYGADRP